MILCWLGFHKWNIPFSGWCEYRYCERCSKKQEWKSAGFPAYDGEWVDL